VASIDVLQDVKARVCAEIERRREDLVDVGRDLFQHPECGYREHYASQLVQEAFKRLGAPYRSGLAITGVKAELKGANPGPTVAILGELDALPLAGHFQADETTGAAHACGHCNQVAMMLGAGRGLLESGALEHLSGRVILFAVPTEEFEEIDYRMELQANGEITYLVGKPELIHLGEFDDIDMALLVHSSPELEPQKLGLWESTNGTVVKRIQYLGRAVHAAAAPHEGINALNAAMIGLSAIHAQRETFRDEDSVRIHPIISRGGEAPNVVPSDVQVETYVRGRTLPAMQDADKKVDRALRAGALAVGAKVRITTFPGGLPMIQNPVMAEVFRANAEKLVGERGYKGGGLLAGSTDMGDLSWIMPCLQPSAGGVSGALHSIDFKVSDYDLAVLNPAKALAMTTVDLLAQDARLARQVLSETKSAMTQQQYRAYLRKMSRDHTYSET
jgi:amidohydrolase